MVEGDQRFMDDSPGPLYEELYKTIGITEELVNVITLAAIDFGWTDGDLYETELVDMPPLSEVIDTDDPEGWIRERIKDTEKRFALVIMELLEEDYTRFEVIESAAYSFGEHYRLPVQADAGQAWQEIRKILLDGMPGDGYVTVTREDPDVVEWELTSDIHGKYWEEAGGEREYFYILRERVIEGMLSDCPVRLITDKKGHYRLEKE